MKTRRGEFHFGDAMENMANLADNEVDCIVSDVPYPVISGGRTGNNKNKFDAKNGSVLSKGDGKIFTHNDVRPSVFLPEFKRILKPGGHCYVFTNNLSARELLNVAHDIDLRLNQRLYWRKNNVNPSKTYMRQSEIIFLFYKPPFEYTNSPSTKEIIDIDDIRADPETIDNAPGGIEAKNPKSPKLHPTQKPEDLLTVMIEQSTSYGQVVADPFAGCGSTCLAALKAGRRYWGCEIDPLYYYPASARLFTADGIAQ